MMNNKISNKTNVGGYSEKGTQILSYCELSQCC